MTVHRPHVNIHAAQRYGWVRTVYAYRITCTYLLIVVMLIALLAIL